MNNYELNTSIKLMHSVHLGSKAYVILPKHSFSFTVAS